MSSGRSRGKTCGRGLWGGQDLFRGEAAKIGFRFAGSGQRMRLSEYVESRTFYYVAETRAVMRWIQHTLCTRLTRFCLAAPPLSSVLGCMAVSDFAIGQVVGQVAARPPIWIDPQRCTRIAEVTEGARTERFLDCEGADGCCSRGRGRCREERARGG